MVRAHWSLPDGGPKTYRKRETLTTTVDRHDYSLLKLVDFIGENFVWGSKQYISLWRAVEDDCIEITFLCASSPVGRTQLEQQLGQATNELRFVLISFFLSRLLISCSHV